MDHVIYLYAAAVVLAVALAGIAVWSPRATRIKVVALTLTALIMPTAYASLMDLLGKPKPVTMEYWTHKPWYPDRFRTLSVAGWQSVHMKKTATTEIPFAGEMKHSGTISLSGAPWSGMHPTI